MMTSARTLFSLIAVISVFCLSAGKAEALLQAHTDYNGCFTCHKLHGAPPGNSLLSGVDTEATCLGCHGPLSIATEVGIHDPGGVGAGNQGHITCRECHDAHDNLGTNVKMLGYDFDPETGLGANAVGPQIPVTTPALRLELPATPAPDPGDPFASTYATVVYENNSDFNRGASNNGPCQICHTAGPVGGGDSGVGNFAGHAWGDNCASCHMHADGFKKRHCVECHDTTATLTAAAPKVVTKAGASVAAVGSHLRVNGADPIVGLTDFEWTAQCIECHTGHTGDVLVPNNPAVGIDFQMTGGIGLGGNATTATTEAEICWECHGAGQSEWNALADHGFTVTGGEDWTAVSFDLAGTTVPTKTTTSIHSVNDTIPEAIASSVTANLSWSTDVHWIGQSATIVSDASKVLESVADIRCTYCHDVHDTNLAPNDTTSGQPYLRGSWLHNPYVATDVERPPESGDNWTGNRWSHFDNGDTVPRLRTDVSSANLVGGYQIDQNNGSPTAGESLASTAGLCVLCHGSNVNTMDYFSTFSLWAGTNGHSNSTLGGTGSAAVDLFDARNRNGQLSTAMGFYMAGQGADNWDNLNNVNEWGNQNFSGNPRNETLPYGDRGDNLNPDDSNASGLSNTPPLWTGYFGGTAIAGNRRNTDVFSVDYATWFSAGGIGDNGGTSGRAHDFSCSKCHTPHASGLPALLVSNCLDFTISNWSETASGPKGGGNTTLGPSATNRWAKEAMNNCHRKDDSNAIGVDSPGWNLLAPRQ